MITSTMDALVWLGPRKMELRREPAPTPEPGEVLVAVEAVGICGSELSGYPDHGARSGGANRLRQ
jgi:L-iditol 2-dehydrogenase